MRPQEYEGHLTVVFRKLEVNIVFKLVIFLNFRMCPNDVLNDSYIDQAHFKTSIAPFGWIPFFCQI